MTAPGCSSLKWKVPLPSAVAVCVLPLASVRCTCAPPTGALVSASFTEPTMPPTLGRDSSGQSTSTYCGPLGGAAAGGGGGGAAAPGGAPGAPKGAGGGAPKGLGAIGATPGAEASPGGRPGGAP